MKAIILIVSSLLGFVTAPAWAAPYERNTARPVDQVVFGQVDTVRNITQRQMVESEHSGWKTLGGDGLINVIQDYDPAMVFASGDKVRILYFSDGVRVDKTY